MVTDVVDVHDDNAEQAQPSPELACTPSNHRNALSLTNHVSPLHWISITLLRLPAELNAFSPTNVHFGNAPVISNVPLKSKNAKSPTFSRAPPFKIMAESRPVLENASVPMDVQFGK